MKPKSKHLTMAKENPTILKPEFLLVMMFFLLGYGCGNSPAEKPRHYPEEGTPQANLYLAKCGQCHGAPLPSAHTANVWPSVLDRMQVHIKSNNVAPVSREEMSIILGYLQLNAQKPAENQSGLQQATPQNSNQGQTHQPQVGTNE